MANAVDGLLARGRGRGCGCGCGSGSGGWWWQRQRSWWPSSCELDVDSTCCFWRDDVAGFWTALPRTPAASSDADFFFAFSSSEERLEDMMVSKVPTALPLLLGPRLCRFVMLCKSPGRCATA